MRKLSSLACLATLALAAAATAEAEEILLSRPCHVEGEPWGFSRHDTASGAVTLLAPLNKRTPVALAATPAGTLVAALLEENSDALVTEIDLVTGHQSILHSGAPLVGPSSVAVSTTGRLFVADPAARAVFEVLPGGGTATVIDALDASAVAVEATGALVVADAVTDTLWRVSPDVGVPAPISQGGSLDVPVSLAVEATGTILALETGGPTTVLRIAADTGAQSVLSTGGELLGPPEGTPRDMKLDPDGDPVVTIDLCCDLTGVLVSIDAQDGTQAQIGRTRNKGRTAITFVEGELLVSTRIDIRGPGNCDLVLLSPRPPGVPIHDFGDSASGRFVVGADGLFYVLSPGLGVVRYDPVSGERTALSMGGHFRLPSAIAAAPDGDLVVTDRSRVIGVDVDTGAQTLVSLGGLLERPVGVVVGPDGTIWVAEHSRAALLRIDPDTGAQSVAAEGLVRATHLLRDPLGFFLVTTNVPLHRTTQTSFWRVEPFGGPRRKLAAFPVIVDATLSPDGTILTLDHLGRIARLDPATGATASLFDAGPLLGVTPTAATAAPPVQPTILRAPTALLRTQTVGLDAADHQLAIENSGPGTLSWSVSADVPWLAFEPESGASDGEADTVRVHFATAALAQGRHDATITVEDVDGRRSETIPVGLNVLASQVRPPGGLLVADLLAGAMLRVDLGTGDQTLVAQGDPLVRPAGAAPDGLSSVLVSDLVADAIVRVDTRDGAQTVLASGDGLSRVTDLVVAPGPEILAVDADRGALLRVVQGGEPEVLADGFALPTGLALDGLGRALVADADAAAILAVELHDGSSSLVAAGGLLQRPVGIALEDPDHLLVADTGLDAIVRIDLGAGGAQSIVSQGGLLIDPVRILPDGDGRLFVSDETAGRLVRIHAATGVQGLVSEGGALRAPRGLVALPEPGAAGTAAALAALLARSAAHRRVWGRGVPDRRSAGGRVRSTSERRAADETR